MSFLGRLVRDARGKIGGLANTARRLGRPISSAIHHLKPCVDKVGGDVTQFLNEVDRTEGLGDIASPYTAAGRRAIQRGRQISNRLDQGARRADRFLR